MVTALREIREDARKNQWEAFLFGGVPRTFWISGPSARVRDFDLVFRDDAFVELSEVYSKRILRTNRFGGIKMEINGIDIDAWPLSSTWAFRQGLVTQPSFENLPRTTFLNIDSIAVELAPTRGKPRRLFEFGFFRALRNQMLEICLKANPFPELCAIRSLRLSATLGFGFSTDLARYVLEIIEAGSVDVLREIQLQHYGRIWCDRDDLFTFASRLRSALRSGVERIKIFETTGRQPELWEADSFHSF